MPGAEAVLVFSFVGYEQVQEVVGDRTVLNVRMQPSVEVLTEIVVVGYGVQRREDVTGSVASVSIDEINQGRYISADQLLQGRIAGLTIVANNGEPGAGMNIRLRGGTSISASNEPLIVIDGVPIDNVPLTPGGASVNGAPPPPRNPLSLINPNDIESITVLKDAAATAIYVSRRANGVILIETKKGRQGQLQVDYDGYVTAATPYLRWMCLTATSIGALWKSKFNGGICQRRRALYGGVPIPIGKKPLCVRRLPILIIWRLLGERAKRVIVLR